MDQILVDNREFFIHHLHSTPPLRWTETYNQPRRCCHPLKYGWHVVLAAHPVRRVCVDLLTHLFYSFLNKLIDRLLNNGLIEFLSWCLIYLERPLNLLYRLL